MINIALILLSFVGTKKKLSPYISAGLLCVIKMVIYYFTVHTIFAAVVNGAIVGVFAFTFAFFLKRIGEKPPTAVAYGSPGSKNAGSDFSWEYIPLACALFMMIFGEFLVSMLFTIQF